MMPDIIVYVYEASASKVTASANPATSSSSSRKARGSCIGYLRIPMDGKKRPTEMWEKGQDLTIFPKLWGVIEDGSGGHPLLNSVLLCLLM